MLRIQDILVRIRGSLPVTNGSGSGYWSRYFRHWPSRRQQKTRNKGFSNYFCLMIKGTGFGSGSRRPKNIRIRIRNASFLYKNKVNSVVSKLWKRTNPNPDLNWHKEISHHCTVSMVMHKNKTHHAHQLWNYKIKKPTAYLTLLKWFKNVPLQVY